MTVGEKLRNYMKRRGFKQASVAEHIGITKQALNYSLNGKTKMNADAFVAACEFLQVSPDEVLREGTADGAMA